MTDDRGRVINLTIDKRIIDSEGHREERLKKKINRALEILGQYKNV